MLGVAWFMPMPYKSSQIISQTLHCPLPAGPDSFSHVVFSARPLNSQEKSKRVQHRFMQVTPDVLHYCTGQSKESFIPRSRCAKTNFRNAASYGYFPPVRSMHSKVGFK